MKYFIWLTNFGYALNEDDFTDLEAAIARAKKTSFQCGIWSTDGKNHTLAAAVCPLAGVTYY